MALPQPNPARIEVPAPFFQDNSLVRGDQLRDNNAAIWENLEYLDDEIIAEAGARESADETLQDNIDAEATARSNADSTLQTNINGKQATLVSGTNIKSINGNSLLGAGDLTVTTDVAAAINSAATKSVPAGADKLGLVDTEDSNVLKDLTINDLISHFNKLYTFASYTPNFGSGMGTVTGITTHYKRIGSCIVIQGVFTTGTVTSSTEVWISLPSGLSINTSAYVSKRNNVGMYTRCVATSYIFAQGNISGVLCYDSDLGATKLRLSSVIDLTGVQARAGDFLFNPSENVVFHTQPIEIAEWV